MDDGIDDLEIAVDAPTRAEIYAALKEMKNGTAGGVDKPGYQNSKSRPGNFLGCLRAITGRLKTWVDSETS